MSDEKTNEPIRPYAAGDSGDMVLVVDAERIRFALLADGPPDFVLDESKWVDNGYGQMIHPPVLVGVGEHRHAIDRRVREIDAKRGDRIALRRADIRQLWSMTCGKCNQEGGARYAARCRRDEHRREGHWVIFNSGRIGIDAGHIEGEKFAIDQGALLILEHERRIREGADPRTLKV